MSTGTEETTPLLTAQRNKQAARKKRSLLPALLVLELLFTTLWIASGWDKGVLNTSQAATLAIVPLLQAVWCFWVIRMGRRQFFAQQNVLDSMPMIWLPMFPVILQTIIFSLQWSAVEELLESTYMSVVALQGLRVLAVGSIFKWQMGLFPTAFAWGTAFPDMIFGATALLWLLLDGGSMDFQALLYWNATGLAIILPVGVLIVQAGMKPTQLYASTAPYRLVFEYPMVLGPAAVVPTLLAWNGIVIRFAYEQLQKQ